MVIFSIGATLATKTELKAEQDKNLKLQALDSSYFGGKNHFEGDGTLSYSIFQPMYRYLNKNGDIDYISEWKSKRLSDETIKPPNISQ